MDGPSPFGSTDAVESSVLKKQYNECATTSRYTSDSERLTVL